MNPGANGLCCYSSLANEIGSKLPWWATPLNESEKREYFTHSLIQPHTHTHAHAHAHTRVYNYYIIQQHSAAARYTEGSI